MPAKRSALGLEIAVRLLSACGKDLDEACSPQFENEYDVLQDDVFVNCAGSGGSSSQGSCDMKDYADDV